MSTTAPLQLPLWQTRVIGIAAVVAMMVLLAVFSSNSSVRAGADDAPLVESLDEDWAWAGQLWL